MVSARFEKPRLAIMSGAHKRCSAGSTLENSVVAENTKNKRYLLVQYLGTGILPFDQWCGVFANPELNSRPGLICKAFTVWFPTMLDYLNRPEEVNLCIAELVGDECVDEAANLCDELDRHYKNLLALFSREEQLFLVDRRLQNVHGKLSRFTTERIKTTYYDRDTDRRCVEWVEADDYHEVMRSYYPEMGKVTLHLRNRLVTSERFRMFGDFYKNEVKPDPHLFALGAKMGVITEVNYST